jgi:regulator of sirC expression with transglutaminase-like and TPR domain
VSVSKSYADSPEFLRLVRGDSDADLTQIALEVARDAYPDLEFGPVFEAIDALAHRVRERCPTGSRPRHILGQINWVLYVEEGFRGNTEDYYDPRNSYLNLVIHRKTGIPLSLSVLYRAIAERVGLRLDGVNLPVHFMLLAGPESNPIYIDPFFAGDLLDRRRCEERVSARLGRPAELTEEQFRPCGLDAIVSRMLRNLKGVYVQTEEFDSALPVQHRLVALHPEDPTEGRDLGMLYLQASQPGSAIDPLQRYLTLQPDASDAPAVKALLAAAWREVSRQN